MCIRERVCACDRPQQAGIVDVCAVARVCCPVRLGGGGLNSSCSGHTHPVLRGTLSCRDLQNSPSHPLSTAPLSPFLSVVAVRWCTHDHIPICHPMAVFQPAPPPLPLPTHTFACYKYLGVAVSHRPVVSVPAASLSLPSLPPSLLLPGSIHPLFLPLSPSHYRPGTSCPPSPSPLTSVECSLSQPSSSLSGQVPFL